MKITTINSLALGIYLFNCFFTPLSLYSTFAINLLLLSIWLITAFKIDSNFISKHRSYLLFLIYIVFLDYLYSKNIDNPIIFHQALAGKSLAYFSFYFFLFYNRNLRLLKLPLLCFVLAIIGTGFFTYVGNLAYPGASRSLADPSNEFNSFYRSLFIGGYEYIYSIVFLVLPIVVVLKYRIISNIYLRIFCILLLCFLGTIIIIASYFIGIIITSFILLLYFVKFDKIYKFLLTLIVVVFLFLSLKDIILSSLIQLGETIHSHMLIKRASQILYGTYEEDSANTSRFVLYTNALFNFFKSPIAGKILSYSNSLRAGHSGLLEYLSNYGSLGLVYYVNIFNIYNTIKKKFITNNIKNLFIVSFIIFTVFGLINIFDYSPHICTIAFFISPCVLLFVDKNESTLVNK